jgi:citrate lyase beta subunit
MTLSTLPSELIESLAAPLGEANRRFAQRYPGDSGRRQPVHTVYGGAHLFRADSAARLGALALRALETYAPDAETFAGALGLGATAPTSTTPNAPGGESAAGSTGAPSPGLSAGSFAGAIYEQVVEKLRREPVEDFRIDFEDGYGHRPDEEEDGHAASAAREVARGLAQGTLPPFVGLRIKPFSEELHRRAVRTLDLFVTTLAREAGRLPPGFVVTLPKVTNPEQVALLARLLERLEPALGLAAGELRLEIMVETPQAILDARGRVPLPELVEAAAGRLLAAHFGTYDYTALLEITAAHQHMTHPSCDFAKHVLQVSLAGTGVWLSDGSTNILPVPPHREGEGAAPLSPEQLAENRRAVHAAWRLHFQHVRHSLEGAFYQGWDLHPAQLPTRYAAVYSFFLSGLDAAAERLSNFVAKAAQATLVGKVFDDAATGQGLLNYFLRALNCGAVAEDEVRERTGLSRGELATRSFVKILAGRRRE